MITWLKYLCGALGVVAFFSLLALSPMHASATSLKGSVRTQNTTEKTHSKWGKHFQFEQRMGKRRAFFRLFLAEVGRNSRYHHAVS